MRVVQIFWWLQIVLARKWYWNYVKRTAEWVTQTFIQHFYWAHELFITIVLNWETQFVSSLWKRICQLLNIVQRMFTAYHSKTDEMTECMIQNVELHICTFFNYSQNNWANLLLMTELIINNHNSVFTEMSLFIMSWTHTKVLWSSCLLRL